MARGRWISPLIAVCLAGLAVAHDEDTGHTSHNTILLSNYTVTAPPNFFRHPHHAGWIYAHIATMIAAWGFVLPISVVLSIAKSRYGYRFHHLFHILNFTGVATGHIYSCLTPALYYHHVHGFLGWMVTAVSLIWTVLWISLTSASRKGERKSDHGSFSRFGRILPFPKWLRQDRKDGSREFSERKFDENRDTYDAEFEDVSLLHESSADQYKPRRKRYIHPLAMCACNILERLILLLGFTACVSGFVIYSGNFRGLEVYGGLSHWIKGGIFFWLGLLSLGRWIGAFADFGWAWNLKPSYKYNATQRWKERIPSLEFIESFLIWTYGATNVFLEHLSNWGGEWSATDFEHISITLLFFGGGFLGMLVESPRVQRLLDSGLDVQPIQDDDAIETNSDTTAVASHERPKISLNPLPSLTIMLLGLMMSSHHQLTSLGSKIHAQWGYLFVGSALARITTLIMLYHKSPSYYPARPLTEIITSFCLTAGGILFMMSGRDSIAGLEANDIMAMTAFTATMGLAAVILGWEVVAFAVKGWAEMKAKTANRL